MSSLTCRAMRMTPWCQAAPDATRQAGLPGGLADVIADLAQRPGGLGNRGRRELEDVHLAGPDPHLDRHARGSQPAGGLARVADQHFGTRYVDQRAWQAGFDVVERLVDLFGFAVDHVTFCC